MSANKSTPEFNSFDEFWPHYVREHSKLVTQVLHFIGTACASLIFLYILWLVLTWTWDWWDILLIPIMLFVGYGFAWFSHFFCQKNRPATFTYPKWSFFADFKMSYCILRRTMSKETAKALKR